MQRVLVVTVKQQFHIHMQNAACNEDPKQFPSGMNAAVSPSAKIIGLC